VPLTTAIIRRCDGRCEHCFLAFVNALERPIGTYLYGRRMYETMVFWETVSTETDEPAVFWDYAGIWRVAGVLDDLDRWLAPGKSTHPREQHPRGR
jgi:hypothetical protein